MNDIILTKEALEKLKQEVKELKEKRKEISNRIEIALSHGDLSENFEYHEAKDSQGMNESKINELEYTINRAKIIEKTNTNRVGIGSKVKTLFNEKEFIFEIVSFNQSDPQIGKISNESPIGKALLGRSSGDVVEVLMPNGKKIIYKIIGVE